MVGDYTTFVGRVTLSFNPVWASFWKSIPLFYPSSSSLSDPCLEAADFYCFAKELLTWFASIFFGLWSCISASMSAAESCNNFKLLGSSVFLIVLTTFSDQLCWCIILRFEVDSLSLFTSVLRDFASSILIREVSTEPSSLEIAFWAFRSRLYLTSGFVLSFWEPNSICVWLRGCP